MVRRRSLLLVALTVFLTVVLLGGSAAAAPLTVRSDGGGATIMTHCEWGWWFDGLVWRYCYKCCDMTGCYIVYCQ